MGISRLASSVRQSRKLEGSATVPCAFCTWVVGLMCKKADNFRQKLPGGLTRQVKLSEMLNALGIIGPGVSEVMQKLWLRSVALALISLRLSFSLLCTAVAMHGGVTLRNSSFLKPSATLVRKLEPGSRGNEHFSV